MATMHALRDKWFFSYLPLLTADTVNSEYKGDWELAAVEHTVRLDWVTSVEEMWSTMNSLPKIQSMPAGSIFILSREAKEASFEAFPNGSRVIVTLHKSPATDVGLELIFAAVLGETIAEEVGATVCDVIRLAARPSREYVDLVRVEVWLNDSSYSGKVAQHLRQLMESKQIPANLFSVSEKPFDEVKEKKAPKVEPEKKEEVEEKQPAAEKDEEA